MDVSRRVFMAGAAASAGLFGTGLKATAEVSLGTARLTTVSDGNLMLPGDFIFGDLPMDQVAAIVEPLGVSTKALEPECNVTLLRQGDDVVLFDVGAGGDFQPSAGSLLDSLDALGVAPEEVTHVVFTHAHPDHLWGLLDDFDDPIFTEASFMMGREEWDYWWNPETVNTIGTARQSFAVGAKRRMEVIEDAVEFFNDGDEVLPGVSAIAMVGHTPGHMGFEVRQGNDAALIVGDAIGNHHLAFARPSWSLGSDQNPEVAASTRGVILDRLVSEQMAVVGFHLPDGGIGRAEKEGEGYRFVAG